MVGEQKFINLLDLMLMFVSIIVLGGKGHHVIVCMLIQLNRQHNIMALIAHNI